MEIEDSKLLLNENTCKCINYSPGKAWPDIDANTCLFAWWRKDCQSFQICLFASFTSCLCDCVPTCHEILHPIQTLLRAEWLWAICSSLSALFWLWFCYWLWHGQNPRKNLGVIWQNTSEGLLLQQAPAHSSIPSPFSDLNVDLVTLWNCFSPGTLRVRLRVLTEVSPLVQKIKVFHILPPNKRKQSA